MTHHLIVNKTCSDLSLISNNVVQCCITSVPYGSIRDYSDDIEQVGNTSGDLATEKLACAFKEVFRVLKDGGFLCLNLPNYVGNEGDGFLYPATYSLVNKLLGLGFRLYREVYWKKPGVYSGYGKFPYRFFNDVEPIIILRKVEQKFVGESTSLDSVSRDYDKTSLWEMTPDCSKSHIATFCIELPKRCIISYSKKGDVILDNFVGSGTTSLASKILGRHSIGYELKEDYIKVIKDKIGVNQKSVFGGEEHKYWFIKKDEEFTQLQVKEFLDTGRRPIVEEKKEINQEVIKECTLCGMKSPPAVLDSKDVCDVCGPKELRKTEEG